MEIFQYFVSKINNKPLKRDDRKIVDAVYNTYYETVC